MRPIAWQTSARLQIPASPAFRAETTERPRARGRGSQAPRHALGGRGRRTSSHALGAGAAEGPVAPQPRGSWARACAIPHPADPGLAMARAHAWATHRPPSRAPPAPLE